MAQVRSKARPFAITMAAFEPHLNRGAIRVIAMNLFGKKPQNQNVVPSPCVDICALDDNDICIGCFRSGDEISDWGSMSDDEKKNTLLKVRERRQAK